MRVCDLCGSHTEVRQGCCINLGTYWVSPNSAAATDREWDLCLECRQSIDRVLEAELARLRVAPSAKVSTAPIPQT